MVVLLSAVSAGVVVFYLFGSMVFGDGTIRAGGGSEDGVVDFAVDDIHAEMLRRAFSC